jgi:hypothetical protein
VRKPLKLFILAGQSKMDGNADVSTVDFLGEDPEHGHLLKKSKPDGKTRLPTTSKRLSLPPLSSSKWMSWKFAIALESTYAA